MKKVIAALALSYAVTGMSIPALAQTGIVPTNGFILSGTTNTKLDWNCEGAAQATATPGQSTDAVTGFPKGVSTANVTIAIDKIACSGGKKMDEHLKKALKTDKNPSITYALTGYKISANAVIATGNITIAGETRPIETAVRVAPSANEYVSITGELAIDMAQFNVKPPELMFGALKVLKDVRVNFNIIIRGESLT